MAFESREPRSHVIHVRVSAEEKKWLQDKADAASTNKSAVLRSMILKEIAYEMFRSGQRPPQA